MIQEEWRITGIRISSKSNADVYYGDKIVRIPGEVMARYFLADPYEMFWLEKEDLETSLRELRTDYIDVYQLHMVDRVYQPGDGTGVYEALLEARDAGKIRHIGVTAHKIGVAFDCVESGLYETMQFPFSYL